MTRLAGREGEARQISEGRLLRTVGSSGWGRIETGIERILERYRTAIHKQRFFRAILRRRTGGAQPIECRVRDGELPIMMSQ